MLYWMVYSDKHHFDMVFWYFNKLSFYKYASKIIIFNHFTSAILLSAQVQGTHYKKTHYVVRGGLCTTGHV